MRLLILFTTLLVYQHAVVSGFTTPAPIDGPPPTQPRVTTQGPPATTQGPPATTQGPPATTQGPPATTDHADPQNHYLSSTDYYWYTTYRPYQPEREPSNYTRVCGRGDQFIHECAEPRYVVSPGYPNYSPNNVDCSVRVLTTSKCVHVTSLYLDTEYGFDYFGIRLNGFEVSRYQGAEVVDFRSEEPGELELFYHTDSSVLSPGYELMVRIIQCPEPEPPHICVCGLCEDIYGGVTELSSTNFPGGYENNENCTIEIHSQYGMCPYVYFEEVDLESCCDHLVINEHNVNTGVQIGQQEIYDGLGEEYHGAHGSHLSVHFTTDGSVTARGFKGYASYYDCESQTTPPPPTPPTMAPICEAILPYSDALDYLSQELLTLMQNLRNEFQQLQNPT